MLSFRKNKDPIPRKLTDKWKDGWKDRHTNPIFRTLWAKDGDEKKPTVKNRIACKY